MYDQLKERLLEGRYEAGERVSAEVLRLEFGVSKQPVMEALRRLSGDGLMEIVPQVGSRVARYDLREVEDFYVVFGGFEGTIAGIAALRRTDEQLDILDEVSQRIDALRRSTDQRPGPMATGSGIDVSMRSSTRWPTQESWLRQAGACGTCPIS